MPTDRFLLDPQYKAFTSSQQLKFDTVTNMNDLTCGCLVLLSFLYIPVSILLGWVLLQKVVLDHIYASEGSEIDATVISCEEHYNRDQQQYPTITYFYRVGETVYQGDQTFDSSTSCDFFHPATVISALYLPNDPQQSRIIGFEPSFGTRMIDVLFIGVTLFVMWGSSVFTLAILKYPIDKRRFRRLWRNGILIDGEVVAAKKRITRREFGHYVVITYSFQTPNGRTLTRKQSHLRNDLRNTPLPTVGTPVSILYADDDAVVML
jgi:hypothetical protein